MPTGRRILFSTLLSICVLLLAASAGAGDSPPASAPPASPPPVADLSLSLTGDALFDDYSSMLVENWKAQLPAYDAYVQKLIDDWGLASLRGDPAALRAALSQHFEQGQSWPEFEAVEMQAGRINGTLPPELCAVLQQKHPNDPRVYELFCTMENSRWLDDDTAVPYYRFNRAAWEPFARAAGAGKLRAQGLLMLERLLSYTEADYVETQLEFQQSDLDSLTAGYKEMEGGEQAVADVLAENPQLALTAEELQADHDAAVELAALAGIPDRASLHARLASEYPDWAEGWYEQGRWLLDQGRSAEGLAALKRGNSASDLSSPRAFPADLIYEEIHAGKVPANINVYWAAEISFAEQRIYASPQHFDWKYLQALQGSELLELAQALTQVERRTAQASGPELNSLQLTLIAQARILSTLQQQARDRLLPDSVEQLDQLQLECRDWARRITNYQQQAMMLRVDSFDQNEDPPFPLTGLELLGSVQDVTEGGYLQAAADEQFAAQIAPEILAAWGDWDLTTLSFSSVDPPTVEQ